MKIKRETRRVGETLHVFLGTDGDDFSKKIADLVRPNGDAVIAEDGSSVWVADIEVVDTSKEGSARYTWSSDGNKVKHARTRFNKDATGKVSSTFLKYVYKAME